MPPVSDGDPRRNRRALADARRESLEQRERDREILSDHRVSDIQTVSTVNTAAPYPEIRTAAPYPEIRTYSYPINVPARPGTSAHEQVRAVDYSQMRSWYDQLVRQAPSREPYVPINTLKEKIAIACANDTDYEERWANRSENDREHYRGIAERVLRIIPVPGAREER